MTRLWRSRLLILCILTVIGPACVRYHVPLATGPLDEPRASWSIRTGKWLDEREVCRSDADQPCVIRASSPEERVSVVVSVYLHPVADAKTTYQGALFAECMTSGRRVGAPGRCRH